MCSWGGDVSGSQFLTQLAAVVIAFAFSGIGTLIVARVVSVFIPLRATEKSETQGLDVPMDGEETYVDGEGALLIPVGNSTEGGAGGQWRRGG